jgi:hypothetical protein
MEDSGSAAAASARTMRMQSTSTRRAGGKRLCAILSSEARKFSKMAYVRDRVASEIARSYSFRLKITESGAGVR